MNQIELIPGTSRDTSKSQYFSPPDLAKRVVEWADIHRKTDSKRAFSVDPPRVLEPSAGNGALVRPLVAAGAVVHAFEIDERYRADLGRETGSWGWVWMHDFLKCEPSRDIEFDLCVMNPPYEHGQDVAFILHALKFAPRVVGIFRSQILHGKARKRDLWRNVRPTRIAYLSDRPDFGGEYGAMTDFVVLELVQREGLYAAEGGVTVYREPCTVEFW